MNTFNLSGDLSGGRRHIDVTLGSIANQRSRWNGNAPGNYKGQGRVNPACPTVNPSAGCTPGMMPKAGLCYDQARGMPRAAKVHGGFNLAGCFPLKLFRNIGRDINRDLAPPQGPLIIPRLREELSDNILRNAEPQVPGQPGGGAQSHVAAILRQAVREAVQQQQQQPGAPAPITWQQIYQRLVLILITERQKICRIVNGQVAPAPENNDLLSL